jgi:hypothetical protein
MGVLNIHEMLWRVWECTCGKAECNSQAGVYLTRVEYHVRGPAFIKAFINPLAKFRKGKD